MKKNKFSKKSVAIKDCIDRVVSNCDYENSIYDVNQKLNRILYRQNQNKKVLEQLFVNFGFPINCDVEKDELLKKIYENNNKYFSRFDS